jgi:enamine deaminase RidA (YjgF/YER057c/UK114 family)
MPPTTPSRRPAAALRPALAAVLLAPLLGACATTGAAAGSAAAAPGKTVVIPAGEDRAYDEFRYAPAVVVGDTVIVSGIPAGGPGTYEEQVRRMFQRAQRTLAAAGVTFQDVVEIDTFHVLPKDQPAFWAEYQRFLPLHREFFPDGSPAWTAVATPALIAPGAVMEMRLVAVKGAGARQRVQRGAAAAAP